MNQLLDMINCCSPISSGDGKGRPQIKSSRGVDGNLSPPSHEEVYSRRGNPNNRDPYAQSAPQNGNKNGYTIQNQPYLESEDSAIGQNDSINTSLSQHQWFGQSLLLY